MADFSQAITNGFNIAIGLRRQKMQEEGMRLEEAYRRDSLAENKRQFGLDYGLRKSAFDQGINEFNANEKYRRDVFENTKSQQQIENDHAVRRINLAERAQKLDEDVFGYKKKTDADARREAMMGELTAMYGGMLLNGGDPAEAMSFFVGGLLQDEDARRELSLVASEGKDDKLFEQSSGGGSLHLPIFGENAAYLVGQTPDGQKTWMTKGRGKGTDGQPAELPREFFTSAGAAAMMKSPTALRELRKVLGAMRLLTPEEVAAGNEGKVDDAEKVVGLVGQVSAANEQKAKQQAAADNSVAGVDLSLDSLSLAQRRRHTAGLNGPGTGMTPESIVERAQRSVVNRAYDAAETAYPNSEVPPADDGLADVNWKDRVGTWFNNRQRDNAMAANENAAMLQGEAARRNMQGDPLAEVVKAYDEEQAKGAAADPRRLQALEQRMQAEMAAREQRQVAAPAAEQSNTGGASGSWGDPGQTGQTQQPGTGASAPEGLAATPAGARRNQAVRDLWNSQEAFGVKPSMADIVSGTQYGVPSSGVLGEMFAQQEAAYERRAADQKLLMSAAENRSKMVDIFFEKGSDRYDRNGPRRKEMANADAEMVSRIIGERHFAEKTPLADATVRQVVQIGRRAEVDDEYGNMLRDSPELRAAVAVAATNPAVGSIDDLAESAERILQLQRTRPVSPPKMAALIALDRKASAEGWDAGRLKQAQQEIIQSE